MTTVARTHRRARIRVPSKATFVQDFDHHFSPGMYNNCKHVNSPKRDAFVSGYVYAPEPLKEDKYWLGHVIETTNCRTIDFNEEAIRPPREINSTDKGQKDWDIIVKTVPIVKNAILVNERTDVFNDIIHMSWGQLLSDPEVALNLYLYKYVRFRNIKMTVSSLDKAYRPYVKQNYDREHHSLVPLSAMARRIPATSATVYYDYEDHSYQFTARTAPTEVHFDADYTPKGSDTFGIYQKNIGRNQLAVIDDRFNTFGFYDQAPADGYIDYGVAKTVSRNYYTNIKYNYADTQWFTTTFVLKQGAENAPIIHSNFFVGSAIPDPRIIICGGHDDIFRSAEPPNLVSYDNMQTNTVKIGKQDYKSKYISVSDGDIHFTPIPADNTNPTMRDYFLQEVNVFTNTYIRLVHKYKITYEYELEFFAPFPSPIDTDFQKKDYIIVPTTTNTPVMPIPQPVGILKNEKFISDIVRYGLLLFSWFRVGQDVKRAMLSGNNLYIKDELKKKYDDSEKNNSNENKTVEESYTFI